MATVKKTTDSKPAGKVGKRESAIDPNETKEARFKRLGVSRVKRLVALIRNVGNLSNRSVYGYTPEQVEYIFSTVGEALKNAKAKFEERAKESTRVDIKL